MHIVENNIVRKVHKLKNKLIMSGLAGVMIVSFGTVGVASAHQINTDVSTPSNVTQCATQYKQYKFKDKDDCENWWNEHHQGSGYGYGGGHKHEHHHHHNYFHFFSNWWHHVDNGWHGMFHHEHHH